MPTKSSGSDPLDAGPREITKKVRLTAAEAELLAELAESQETSQSDILRKGLRAIRRMRKRQENIDQLIEWAQEDEPEPIDFHLRE